MIQAVGGLRVIGSAVSPDKLDLEELSLILRSDAWRFYTERLKHVITEQQRICETASIHSDALRAQGQLMALRCALEVPHILMREFSIKTK